MQAKLLRAIEERVFRPVGGGRDVQSDFRLVSASNVPLEQLQRAGQVRLDFAFRIAVARICIPPLAQRPTDILPLATYFLRAVGAESQDLSVQAAAALTEYEWPGNVRQLRNVVETAVALGGGVVRAEVVTGLIGKTPSTPLESERHSLLRLLEANDWNARAVAAATGAHRSTIYRMMRRMGINRRRFERRMQFAGVLGETGTRPHSVQAC